MSSENKLNYLKAEGNNRYCSFECKLFYKWKKSTLANCLGSKNKLTRILALEFSPWTQISSRWVYSPTIYAVARDPLLPK